MEKLSLFARLKGAASNFWSLNRSTYPNYLSSGENQYANRGVTLTDEAKVNTETGYIKAFVSNDFLYKPPYGYPRYVDIPTIRALAKSPYVWQVTSTIIDEIGAIDWDITPIEKDEPDKDESEEEIVEDFSKPKVDIQQVKRIKEVKQFFNNPNGNDESFNFLIRSVVQDILVPILYLASFFGNNNFWFITKGNTNLVHPTIAIDYLLHLLFKLSL